MSFLQDVYSTILEQGRLFSFERDKRDKRQIEVLCTALMSGKGEVSGQKIAASTLAAYETLSEDHKRSFFEHLASEYDLSMDDLTAAADRYSEDPSATNLRDLLSKSEPGRQELMRRLNQVPGATEKLVHMREDLLAIVREKSEFARVDSDFEHVFSSWFNRGFLLLKPIDWHTPANILEKIIEYEAVHAINDWDDLRRRLQPSDRRCFAFFHPVMPEEPLIFVEVALTKGTPDSIETLLAENREILPLSNADTAVFYSISNCQKGLKGVSFGNSLIKQVVSDLASDLPGLKNFVTLSPVPGFVSWLREDCGTVDEAILADVEAMLKHTGDTEEIEILEKHRDALMQRMAEYLVSAKRHDGIPRNPVARFHLGNGASLARLNWMADKSPNGLQQSAGMMVNYKYDLATVENNHESYVHKKHVHTTREIRGLAKSGSS